MQKGHDHLHPPRTRERRVGGCLLKTRGYSVAGTESAGSTVTRKPNFSRRRPVHDLVPVPGVMVRLAQILVGLAVGEHMDDNH